MGRHAAFDSVKKCGLGSTLVHVRACESWPSVNTRSYFEITPAAGADLRRGGGGGGGGPGPEMRCYLMESVGNVFQPC